MDFKLFGKTLLASTQEVSEQQTCDTFHTEAPHAAADQLGWELVERFAGALESPASPASDVSH